SVVKSLSSNHALKPLIPTFCLVVVLIYGLADRLRNFVAGIFIPQYHFPYPVALSFALFSFPQVLVSLLFLNLLHALNLVALKPYSRSLGERLLLPAICNSAQAVLTMWAKASSSSASLFLVTVPLLPLVTLALSFTLQLSSLTSCQITERHRHPDTQASAFDIYHTQMVNQSWLLGFLWLLHPDNPWQVVSQSSWHSLLFHGYLLAIILLGMVLNFTVGMSALCVSPLAAALLYSTRQIVQPLLQLLLIRFGFKGRYVYSSSNPFPFGVTGLLEPIPVTCRGRRQGTPWKGLQSVAGPQSHTNTH
uniref:Si:ch211-207n2.7 n=1 Tax=Oryzias latipes TaxID=8090 RepID=H2LK94_ORYLA